MTSGGCTGGICEVEHRVDMESVATRRQSRHRGLHLHSGGANLCELHKARNIREGGVSRAYLKVTVHAAVDGKGSDGGNTSGQSGRHRGRSACW